MPDVAYNAAVMHGVLTYLNIPGVPPGMYTFGGTSAGSPQWAAILAIADQQAGHNLGFINKALYHIGQSKGHYAASFFDVTSGRILIDGQDIRDVTLASLRAQVGIVTQETILFNDTVRNNIAYGQPQVPQKDVEAAARSGEISAEPLRAAAVSVLASEPAAKLDYFEIIDPDTLEPIDDVSQGALAAVAAEFGVTRLIDNILLPRR